MVPSHRMAARPHIDRVRRAAAIALVSSFVLATLVAITAHTGAKPASAEDSYPSGNYLVQLRDEPAALYTGTNPRYAATQIESSDGAQLDARDSDVIRYTKWLETRQRSLAATLGITVGFQYSHVFDGFSAHLSSEQASTLAANDAVEHLEADVSVEEEATVDRTVSSGLGDSSGIGGAWDQVGGVENAGKGVVIGVIDSGIAPENPFFSGDPLQVGASADTPYWQGAPVEGSDMRATAFVKRDGGTFTGACQSGVQFTFDDCSTKIIGARYFVDSFTRARLLPSGEYLSARTGPTGHGAGTASLAAGNPGVIATVPAGADADDYNDLPLAGTAPAAKLSIYKTCWVTTVSNGSSSCPTSAIMAALEAATTDGVDVVNISLGTGISLNAGIGLALEGAEQAGIFVAVSAGNSGPDPSTITGGQPWATTVASHTLVDFDATVNYSYVRASGVVSTLHTYTGRSMFNPRSFPATTLTYGWLEPVQGYAVSQARGCAPGSLDPAKAARTIVLCVVPVVDGVAGTSASRLAMSREVARAGGVAAVLINDARATVPIDAHSIPTVHLPYDSLAYLSSNAVSTTVFTSSFGDNGTVAPISAVSSSRGPVLDYSADLLKPDVDAAGVRQVTANAQAAGEAPTFDAKSGTSFASPVVAGFAALYLTQDPEASPAEIKSAMMTTAQSIKLSDGSESSNVFSQGAGAISGTRFLHPGMVFLNNVDDWRSLDKYYGIDLDATFALPIDPSDLNLASVQIGSLTGSQTVHRQVTSREAGSWTPTVAGMVGITTAVSPSTLTFTAAGQTRDFTITYTRTTAGYDVFATGYLSWTASSGKVARLPMAVRPTGGLERTVGELAGTAASGTVSIEARSSTPLTVVTKPSALAVGVPLAAGSANAGDFVDYPVTITDVAKFARFSLKGVGHNAASDDLELSLWRKSGSDLTIAATAPPGGVSKNLDLFALPVGEYILRVRVSPLSGPVSWTAKQFVSSPASSPSLTVDRPSIDLAANVSQTVTVGWSGLAAGTDYLGIVDFGDPDSRTLVAVEVPEASAVSERTVSIASLELPSPRASAAPQSSSGTLLLTASDRTNTQDGWSVSLTSSSFAYSGNFGTSAANSIAPAQFSIVSLGSVTSSSGQAVDTGGTDAAPTGPQPFSTGVTGTLDRTVKVLRAGGDYGTGTYLLPINVSLAIPAGSAIGLYTATLTATIGVGP